VTVFLIKNQDGAIVADEKGWRQPTGLLGGIVRSMRALSSDRLGDPPTELEAQKELMKNFIAQALGASGQAPVEGYVVFTNPRAQVTLANAKVPVLLLNKQPDALKNALRRDKRASQLPGAIYNDLVAFFDKEAEEKTAQAQNEFRFWRR